MNRREFTASLAALTALPALPVGASAIAPPAAAVPPGAYAWAQLIARAQNRCSPAMLARHLRLGPDAAQALFQQMVRDGVLRAPTLGGLAQAAQPIKMPGAMPKTIGQKVSTWRDVLGRAGTADAPAPLVKDGEPCLGCADQNPEDDQHASADKPVQKGH